jgi:hypothetical protein
MKSQNFYLKTFEIMKNKDKKKYDEYKKQFKDQISLILKSLKQIQIYLSGYKLNLPLFEQIKNF